MKTERSPVFDSGGSEDQTRRDGSTSAKFTPGIFSNGEKSTKGDGSTVNQGFNF